MVSGLIQALATSIRNLRVITLKMLVMYHSVGTESRSPQAEASEEKLNVTPVCAPLWSKMVLL